MPDLDGTVFGAGDNHRKLGVVASEGDVAGVTLQGRDERLGCIIPNLNCLVVRCCEEVWFVGAGVVIDVVDTLGLVGLQGKVGMRGAEVPDLHSAIQTSRGKRVGVLRVDGHAHHIVAMALEDLNALPTLLPIPSPNGHVI